MQAGDDRDFLWRKAATYCDQFYPSRSAFNAVPLSRSKKTEVCDVPDLFTEREWLVARMVLNSNRTEGEEYVQELKEESFCYQSRQEVWQCVNVC